MNKNVLALLYQNLFQMNWKQYSWLLTVALSSILPLRIEFNRMLRATRLPLIFPHHQWPLNSLPLTRTPKSFSVSVRLSRSGMPRQRKLFCGQLIDRIIHVANCTNECYQNGLPIILIARKYPKRKMNSGLILFLCKVALQILSSRMSFETSKIFNLFLATPSS